MAGKDDDKTVFGGPCRVPAPMGRAGDKAAMAGGVRALRVTMDAP